MAKANRPYASRTPKVARAFDFRRLLITGLNHDGAGVLVSLVLTPSDSVLLGVAVSEALSIADLGPGACVSKPITTDADGAEIAVARIPLERVPVGLAVDQRIDLSLIATIEPDGQGAYAMAVTSRGRVKIRSQVSHQRAAAPITMPVMPDHGITDESLGLTRNDAAQLRAEGFITAAFAHRERREQLVQQAAFARKAANAAHKLMPGPMIHTVVPDSAVTLIDPTDKLDQTDGAILAELERAQARPAPSWMQQERDEAQRANIVKFVRFSGSGTLRASGVSLNRIAAKFGTVPEFRVRHLLEEAVARGEIVTLRRATSTGCATAEPVVLYGPTPLKPLQRARDSRVASVSKP